MYDKFDRNAISNENLYYANLKKEKRIKDQTEEMEREKIAMENLKNQMEKEKQYQIDRRNRIKQAQYEDYNNYLRQKYSTPPENREKLNIKLGGEQRNIKKMNYNEEMDNLCINPTTQKYEEFPNAINYSDMGRKYQKGYSHGYNIITGEIYSDNKQNEHNDNNFNNNQNNNNYDYNNEMNDNNKNINERKGISISPEEYEEFLRYKEMKRQKEMERQQQIEKEKYNNNPNYINNNEIRQNKYQFEKAPNEYINQYQNYESMKQKNNFHYEESNEQPKRFGEIREKQNFIKQENKYYEDYQNRLMQNQIKENNNRDYGQIQQNYNEEQNQYQNNKDNNEKKYVYENAYRKFTQEDIDFIYEICLGLADIIIDELHESVTNFFLKKDNNKGYITLNDFKDILYHDLKIDYKSDINNFQTFLDFIVCDKMIEGELIIETKRIINVIKTYSGRDAPNEVDNRPNPNERQDYEKQMIERKQYNDKYNNEENEEQIQFKDKISFPPNQQMNLNEQNINNINNEQPLNKYNKSRENMNENKDMERERYMQFLKEKSAQNNQMRNYPPEEYNNNLYQRENQERNYYEKQNEYNTPNNYNNRPLYEYSEKRELTPSYQSQPQKEFLSYQEQIRRIQNQKEIEDKEKNNNNYQQNNRPISEYDKNRMKNMNTKNNIFKNEEPLKITPKYNDEPLTEKERKELVQKDYAKYLDWQIQEKNRNAKTPYYQRNYNPILDDNNNEPNNYKENIPVDPYKNRNYDMNNRTGYPGNNNFMKK